MKVAFLIDRLDAGGAERHALSLIENLDARVFESRLVRLKPAGVLEQELPPALVEDAYCAQVKSKLDFAAVARLSGILASSSCEAIVATNPYATLYAVLAARRLPAPLPVVSTFHSTDLPGAKNQLQMLLYRCVFPFVDSLVYVCENQRRYWRSRALRGRSDAVIHNGIDTTRFGESVAPESIVRTRQRFGFAADDYVIGICAALRPEKAHEDLLKALSALSASHPMARVLMIGDGPRRGHVEALASTLGLADRVRITGFQQDVRPFIAACDVMTLTSRSETFSLAVLEAMASGKPVVISRTGGADEQVRDGVTGFLFEPGNVEELAARLASLADPALRGSMGREALLDVRRRFPLDAMVSKYQSLLMDVAARRRPMRIRSG